MEGIDGKIGSSTIKFPVFNNLSCCKIKVNEFYEMMYVTVVTCKEEQIELGIYNVVRFLLASSETGIMFRLT